MAVFSQAENGGAQHAYRLLFGHTATHLALTASVTLTLGWLNGSPVKPVPVQLVVMPANDFPTAYDGFRLIGNDCLWPSIAPFNTALQAPYTITLSSPTSDPIYYTTDGSTPTAASTVYSDAIAIETAGATVVKAITIDSAGRVSYPRTSTINGMSLSLGAPIITHRVVEIALTGSSPVPFTEGSFYWGDSSVSLTSEQLTALQSGSITLTHTYIGSGVYDLSVSVYDAGWHGAYASLDDTAVTHELAYPMEVAETLTPFAWANGGIMDIATNADQSLIYVVRSTDSYSSDLYAITPAGTIVHQTSWSRSGGGNSDQLWVDDDGFVIVDLYDNGYKTRRYTPNLSSYTTIATDVRYAHGRADGELVAVDNIAVADDTHLIRTDGSTLRILVDGVEIATKYLENSYQYGLSFARTGNMVAVLRSFPGYSARIVDRYDVDTGGFIDSVELPWPSEPYAMHCAGGKMYLGYGSETIVIYAPTDIAAPTLTFAEVAGWTGRTLEMRAVATVDAASDPFRAAVAWGDDSTTVTTDAGQLATLCTGPAGRVYSHTYATGVYTKVRASVEDTYGLQAHVTTAWIDVDYTFTENITADAVGGVFTFPTAGAVTVTLNALALQKLNWAREHGIGLAVGVKVAVSHEYTRYVNLTGANPSLTLNAADVVSVDSWTSYSRTNATGAFNSWSGGWSSHGTYNDQALVRSAVEFDAFELYVPITGATVTLVVDSAEVEGMTGHLVVFVDDEFTDSTDEEWWLRIGLPSPTIAVSTTTLDRVATVTVTIGGSAAADASGLSVTWGDGASTALGAMLLDELQAGDPIPTGHTYAGDDWYRVGVLVATAAGGGAYWSRSLRAQQGVPELTNGDYYRSVAVAGTGQARRTYMALRLASESGYVVIADDDDHFCGTLGVPTGQVGDRVFGSAGPGRIVPHPADPTRIYVEDGIISSSSWVCIFHDGAFERAIPGTDLSQYAWDVTNDGSVLATSPSWNYVLKTNATNTASVTISPSSWNGSTMGVAYDAGTDSMWVMGQDYLFRMTDDGVVHEQISGWFGRAQIVDGVLYAQRGSESSIAKYVLNGTVALSTLTMTPTICDAYASNYNPAGGRNWFYVADGTLYWVDFDAGNAATYGHVNELATLPATVNCYLHPTAATGLDTYVAAVPAHVMLLGEGVDGATTILDEGGRTVTVVGTVHIENTAGDQSIVFDGSSHLTMDGADFHLQGGNWTIALQVKPDAVAQCLLLSLRPYLDGYAPILLFINNGYLSLYMSSDNASWLNSDTSTGTQSIPTGSWTGIEICRNGTAFTVRVNGVTDLTWSSSASLANAASTIAIGGGYAWDYSMGFLGRMRKIFVAKDVVLHTADFDPATVTYPTGGTPASGTPGWLRHVAADIEGTPESVAGATANYWKHLNLTNMHGEPRANIARTWTNTAENGGDAYAGLQVQGALPLEVTFGELPEGALPVSVNVVGFFPGFTTRAYYDGGGWGYWYDSYAAGQFVLSAREQLPGATAVVSSALTDTASTTYNPTTWTLATAPGGASWSNTTVNALRVKVTPDAGAPTVRSAGMMLAVSLLAGTAAPTGTFVLTEEDEVTGTVTCLLTASDDDGDIVRVVVQWGDGQTSTYTAAADLAAITSPGGMTITHVYAGTYTATATIVDAAEHLTTLTLVPAEDNVAPGAEVTSVAPMAAPNTRYIHATVSATDPDGNLDHVTVHWSDTESTTYTDADVPGHTDHASWFFDAWHTYTEDLYPYGGTFGIYAVAVDTNDVETVPGGIVLYSFTVTDLLPDLALVVTPQGDDAYTISCTPSDYDNPGWGEAQTVTLYPSWGDLATYPLDGNAPGPAATVALMLANNFTATVDYAPYPAGVHNLVAEVTAENGIVVRTLAEIERAEPPVVEIVSLVAGPHTRRYTATLRATDPDDNLDALTLQWAPGVIDTITLTTESRAALAAGTHTAAHTYSETDHPTGGTFTVTLTGTDALDATGTDTDEVTITDVLPEIGLAALLASGNSYHVTCAPADADNSTWDATATVTLYHSWGDFGTYPLSGSVPPGMTTTSVDAGDDFAADLTYTAGTHHLVAEVTAENGTVVRETVTITHAIPPAAFITAIVPNQSNGREVVATIGATDADDNLASLTIQWDTGITDTIAYADLSLMARAQLALGTYPRTHTYSETAYPFGGTFGVFVTATDTLGATTPPEEIATVTITITDEAPTLALTATKTGVSTYTIACVPTDHDNPAWNTSAVVTVYLSWGDLTTYPLDGPVPDGIGGVTLTSAQSFSMSIDYVNEPHGAITIVGEVTSENGTVVRAATEISHDNAAPTLSASASRLGPTSVRLSYTATDSDGTVTAIEYDHGDGTWHAATITPGASVSGTIDVSYTQPGTFTPRLRAQDNDGAWSAVTSTTHFTIDATPTVTLAALSVVGRRVMVRVNVTPRLLPVTVMELRFVDDYDQAVYTLAGEDITSGLDPFSYDFADYTFTTLLPPEGVTGTLYAYAYTAANGIYGTCSFDLTVNNASPVVTGGAVTMVNDDTTAAFSLSATDADGTVAAVEYDAGDGEWVDLDITPGATVEMVVNHTYTIAGSYNLRARARDNDGLWSAPVTLSPSAVVDTSPRVTLVGDATPGARTVALTLRARAVVPARSITSLYINWWDGAEEEILVSGLSPAEQAALGTTGVTFSHSAAGVPHAGGIASTYVLATDSALETGVYLHVVIFVNTTPVIQAEEIVLAPDNRSATVTVAISDPDYPAWNPSQWRYYLAWPYDGLYTEDVPANVSVTADGTVTGSLTTTLSYPDHGEYAPVLEVIDAGGAPGRTRLTLSLLNDAPSAGLAVVLVNQLAVTVLPTASDADGTLASVTLDWGDGTTLTPTLGANASHTYAADGTYTVTLTAIDDHGSTASVTEEITVSATPNVPPTCALALVSIIP
jgi:PKD repeat protein